MTRTLIDPPLDRTAQGGAPPAAGPAAAEAVGDPDEHAEARATLRAWLDDARFDGIVRLHDESDIVEQRGSIEVAYSVAAAAADAFHALLRERFAAGQAITTFGPYSPGQAVAQRRLGIEGIYLGGWATSAKGSMTEDPGPDLASYPLSQVPDEAAGIVRALLTADRKQAFERSRMSAEERRATPAVDYRPFIIADADTGHGGDAHVRNLIRRFVEVGVPGYHIEDQRPGAKKCGHQDGKVLVAQHEQNKRLNAARFQLDVMGVRGIIVARTDAEAATLIDDMSDERDQPFVLGATNPDVPTFRVGSVAIHALLDDLGLTGVHGHRLFAIDPEARDAAVGWLERVGLRAWIEERVAAGLAAGTAEHALLDEIDGRYVEAWAAAAGVMTYGDAVGAALESGDIPADRETLDAWRAFAATASLARARARAATLGVSPAWDPEAPRTLEGYYRVRGGIDYAIAKSLGAAPFADLLWMETKTADLADARRFADAIHAVHPDKMLAYNLSPSFNWDTTGMTDDEMRRFPAELGRLGFVFNFITYGGHQIDGLAAEEFSADLRRDGMLALARLQRRLRLIESPYRTPQALVGGDRADAALMAASGRTAATRAMGARSTHRQHLARTETTPDVLTAWLAARVAADPAADGLRAVVRPRSMGSDRLELRILDRSGESRVTVAFGPVGGEAGRRALSIGPLRISPGTAPAIGDLATLFLLHRERPEVLVWLDGEGDGDRLARIEHLGWVEAVDRGRAGVGGALVCREAVESAAAGAAHGSIGAERLP